jgi:predicted phage terminase large subunit-like protein
VSLLNPGTVSLKDIPSILHLLPEQEQAKLLEDLKLLENLKTKETAQTKFMSFVRLVWPAFISGKHHAVMANAFERVANGQAKRLIINMPPRHTKSEFASYLLPAWFLGKFPHKKVIQTSHTAELAVGFGRKVRNLVDTDVYKSVFPGVGLQSDSKAAGRWATNAGGDYFAIGVGGAVTGKGADILIIDDPHSEQEATLAETNSDIYDKTYEWYTSGPRQRLQPGGSIIIVMCMTGDTPVLMADGTEKPLRGIRVGDEVATYDNNTLGTSKVLNHQSNGVDSIYTVQTQSGKILRANERHPFLVEQEGVRTWVRLKNLKLGMPLVVMKDAIAPHGHKQNPDCATHAKPPQPTTVNILMRLVNRLGIMVNGLAFYASAESLLAPEGYAKSVTPNNTHRPLELQRKKEPAGLSTDTESLPTNTTSWLKRGITGVMSAITNPLKKILERTGTENFASTIATTQGKSGVFSAMTATLRSDTEKRPKHLDVPPHTSSFILDKIVSIISSGEEEVFDIEVERTHNFIANGVVSHNTRWSKKDLTGQVLKSEIQRGGEEWEVIEFPALFEDYDPPRPLWPEFWSLKELLALKTELPASKWQAQYMQQPTSEVSAIVKREWWKIWDEDKPPLCEFKIQSWDTAFLKTERSDYSACTTWGVFYKEDDTGKAQAHIILLNAFKDRMEFPELKQVAFKHYKLWNPDALIVEAKATGAPLIFELRAMGIPVQEFVPSRGNDKIARLNAVADIFASGKVWVPNTNWAEELVEEVASFPSGEHDDLVDSMTQALLRFRRGGFIPLLTDEPEPRKEFKRHKAYY